MKKLNGQEWGTCIEQQMGIKLKLVNYFLVPSTFTVCQYL